MIIVKIPIISNLSLVSSLSPFKNKAMLPKENSPTCKLGKLLIELVRNKNSSGYSVSYKR